MNRSKWKAQQAAKAAAMKGRGTKDDPRLRGRELLHGGRTLEVRIYVNTDEPAEALLARLQGPAQGPELRMVLFAISEIDPAAAEKLWGTTWKAAEATVRREN